MKLTQTEIAGLATDLPDWHVEGAALRRGLKFADFATAWGFMTRVALLAEKLDHHPDWSNSYGRVDITLTNHDLGGISALDVTLAKAIDRLAVP